MFADVNVERQAKDAHKREDHPKRRFIYIKLTCPHSERLLSDISKVGNGVILLLLPDTNLGKISRMLDEVSIVECNEKQVPVFALPK